MGDLLAGIKAKFLERADLFRRCTVHFFQLHPVVKGKDTHRRPVAFAVGGPMYLFQNFVVAQVWAQHAAFKEELQFSPAGIGGRAAMARYGQCTTSVGVSQGGWPIFAVQPAFQQTRHKAVACAQYVEHLDREARAGFTVIKAVGNVAGKGHGTIGTTFADQCRARHFAHGAQGFNRVCAAARDVEFFLGSDDQIEQMQCRLQFCCDGIRRDKAVFAVAVTGQAPEVRSVIDVERGLRAVFACKFQCFENSGFGARVGQVGACRNDRTGRRDKVFVNVIFGQRHIGTVFAIEDQGELLFVTNAQQNQCGKAFRIGNHALGVHAFRSQLFADKATHVFIADAGQKGRFQTQTRSACSHVGGRAADVFFKAGHVFQPAAYLCAI